MVATADWKKDIDRNDVRINDGVSIAETGRKKFLAKLSEDGRAACPPNSAENSPEKGLMLGPGAVTATTLSVDRFMATDCAPEASAETAYVVGPADCSAGRK